MRYFDETYSLGAHGKNQLVARVLYLSMLFRPIHLM